MKKQNFARSKKFNDIVFYAVMAAWPLLHFAMFYIGKNFNSILNMFRVYDRTGNYTWSFTDSFTKLVAEIKNESLMQYALPNSVVGYLIVAVLGNLATVFFSYYVYKKAPAAGFFKVMLFLPQMISAVVMVSLFSYFVEDMIPAMLDAVFGLKGVRFLSNAQTRFGTILFYCVWVNFGGSILLFLGSMQSISDSVVEAAQLDGAVGAREFFYITLPSIFPTLTTFIVVGIVMIFTDQFHVYSFYGQSADTRCYTVGYYVFNKISTARSMQAYPMLSALGNIMTLIAVPVTLGTKWLLETFGPSTEEKKYGKKKY